MTAEREPEWEGGRDPEARPGEGWSARALMGRMRLGDEAAFDEYVARFGPLLREMAMRYGGIRDFGETIAADVLHDVAEAIRAHRVPRETNLGPYLVGALRRHILSLREAHDRRAALDAALSTALEGERERAIAGTVSAYTLGATRSPDAEDGGAHDSVVRRFHDFVRSIVTEEEWMMLGWKSERVLGREIAEWLGRPHGTVRSDLHRVEARIASASRSWLTTLEPLERAYIERRYLDRLRPVKRRKRGDSHE